MKPYPIQLEISGPTAMWTRDCRTFNRVYPQIRQPAVGELSVGNLLPIRQPLDGESTALEQPPSSLDKGPPLPPAVVLLFLKAGNASYENGLHGAGLKLDHQELDTIP